MTRAMTTAHRTAVACVRDREAPSRTAQGVPGEQPDAVGLAYYDGLTCRQVATKLEIPSDTARNTIRDGLLHVRDVLSPT